MSWCFVLHCPSFTHLLKATFWLVSSCLWHKHWGSKACMSNNSKILHQSNNCSMHTYSGDVAQRIEHQTLDQRVILSMGSNPSCDKKLFLGVTLKCKLRQSSGVVWEGLKVMFIYNRTCGQKLLRLRALSDSLLYPESWTWYGGQGKKFLVGKIKFCPLIRGGSRILCGGGSRNTKSGVFNAWRGVATNTMWEGSGEYCVNIPNPRLTPLPKALSLDPPLALSEFFFILDRCMQSQVRPVKTDFMFYISSRARFNPNSGKNCTNFYFANFLAKLHKLGIPMKKFVQLYYFCAILFALARPFSINSGCKTWNQF